MPATLGGWGLQRYGASPRRVDALQHYRRGGAGLGIRRPSAGLCWELEPQLLCTWWERLSSHQSCPPPPVIPSYRNLSLRHNQLPFPLRRDRLAEVWRLMAEEREAALQRVAPAAFVTFKTREAQVRRCAAQSSQQHAPRLAPRHKTHKSALFSRPRNSGPSSSPAPCQPQPSLCPSAPPHPPPPHPPPPTPTPTHPHTLPPKVVAAHSLMHHDPTAWRCRPAPGPREVVWQNVG